MMKLWRTLLKAEWNGSNTGILFVDQLDWTNGKKGWLKKSQSILMIGAKQAEIIGKLLRGRLLKDRVPTLAGSDIRVVFEKGNQSGYSVEDNQVRIVLDKSTVIHLSKKLIPKMTEFEVLPKNQLTLRIAKTMITDQKGNVVRTIG